MIRICVFVIYSLLIISCTTNPKENIEIIDLTNGLGNCRKIYLSEIASNIEYIPLETGKDSYIGTIAQVKFCNGFIFILDSKSKVVYIFNNNGKYAAQINSIGKGPGEYIKLSDLEIYPKDTSIFVFDIEVHKLIKYDIHGQFINEWRLQEQSSSAFSIFDGLSFIFLTTYPRNAYNDGYSLAVYDSNLNLVNKFINKDILPKEVAHSTQVTGNYTLHTYCDTLTYWERKKDIVYKITDINTVLPKYQIVYPNPMPLNGKIKNGYNGLFGFIETCNYMFFWGDYEDNPFRTLYSKKTNEITTNSLKYRDELNYGFINDIDGGYTFYPDEATPDGKLYCTFSLFELKQFLKKKTNIKAEVVSEQKRAELLKLIENSKLQDNKCLMIVTLK
jgi:hypothetical protein